MITSLRSLTISGTVLAALLAAKGTAATISLTPIGNPGNAGELSGAAAGGFGPNATVGAVSYAYNIGTYEVTNSQYAEFLNAKDATGANLLSLYNNQMAGDALTGGISLTASNPNGGKYRAKSGHENQPVNYVSWYDAIRFVNWLNNGQGNSDTESGAYTLQGGTPIPSNGLSITRNPGATVYLPNENEWYKSAFYNPATSSYFDYPTASNTLPTAAAPPGSSNSANYNNALGRLNDVGAFTSSASPYGTFDQGGNVWEWNETLFSGSFRNIRGAAYRSDVPAYLLASFRTTEFLSLYPPTSENDNVGFRVASVPEPSTLALVACGLLVAGLTAHRCRRTPKRMGAHRAHPIGAGRS